DAARPGSAPATGRPGSGGPAGARQRPEPLVEAAIALERHAAPHVRRHHPPGRRAAGSAGARLHRVRRARGMAGIARAVPRPGGGEPLRPAPSRMGCCGEPRGARAQRLPPTGVAAVTGWRRLLHAGRPSGLALPRTRRWVSAAANAALVAVLSLGLVLPPAVALAQEPESLLERRVKAAL